MIPITKSGKPTLIIFLTLLINLFHCSPEKKTQHLSNEQKLGVLDSLNQLISAQSGEGNLYILRAQYFAEEEQLVAAITDVNKAITLDSLNKEYYYYLADLYVLNSQSKEALSIMERIVSKFPNHVDVLLKYIRLYLILQKHMNAMAVLDKVFLLDPQNAEAYYLAGHVFYETGDTGRAVNSYQKAVDFDPELKAAWNQLGDVMTELNNPLAIKYYDNAIHLDSSNVETLHNKAYALQKFGKIKESIDLHVAICKRFPTYEPAFYNLGLLYKKIDSLDRAIFYFEKSIQLAPLEAVTYYQRGLCYQKSGKLDSAKTDFETALRLRNEAWPEVQSALQSLYK
ncbi:MAG: tetratricopeptide repeat protein [Bacteroidota bacterium]|nr:tetratricopeptide repeat protein [Bacteroidota bacterium]